MWCSARFNFRSSTVYVNNMNQTAEDLCLLFQHKSVTEIKKKVNQKTSAIICDWFVDNEIVIHFAEDKMKSILFSSKRNLKLVEELDITCGDKNEAT